MFCNADSEKLTLRQMSKEPPFSSAGNAPDEVMAQSTNSLMLPVAAGQYFEATVSDLDLFKGYKINTQDNEPTFKSKVFSGSIAVRPNGQQFVKASVIRKMEDFNELMQVSGELSVSYGPLIEGKGNGKYVDEHVSSLNKVVVMYVSRRAAYSLITSEVKPSDEVEDFIKNGDTSKIYDKFGTLFVDEIQYGGYLSVLYTVQSEKSVDIELIEAELVASIGVGPLKGEIKAKFDKLDGQKKSEYTMKIRVKAIGIQDLDVPLNPTFEEVSNIIKEYNGKYNKLVSELDFQDINDIRDLPISKQMVPVALGFDHTSNYIHELNAAEAAYMMTQMRNLSNALTRTLFYKAKLSVERKQMELKSKGQPVFRRRVLNKWLISKKSADDRLDGQIEECLDFRGEKVEDIFTQKLRAPEDLSTLEQDKIHALLGEGFVFPLVLKGKTFQDMYYEGYTMFENDVEVPFYFGSVSCDDDGSVIAGPDELDDLNINSNACGPRSSCLELKKTTGAQLDGEYDIGYPLFKVYCKGMSQKHPKEYLDLRGLENFSQYLLRGGYVTGTTAITTFHKIRINPHNLEVDVKDLTFTTSVGKITQNSGYVVETLPYGVASDCVGGNYGTAKIDLTGTSFNIAAGFKLVGGGWKTKCVILEQTKQVLRFKGGGTCGACSIKNLKLVLDVSVVVS